MAEMTQSTSPSEQTLSGSQLNYKMADQDIKKMCAEVLRRPVEKVKIEKSFLAQGGDSLLAIMLMARCGEAGYSVSINDILQATSIRQLCQSAKREESSAELPIMNETNHASLSSRQLERPTMLTKMQQFYASTGALQAKLIRLDYHVAENALFTALEALIHRHSMLRARLAADAGDCQEWYLATEVDDSFIYETRGIPSDFDGPEQVLMDSVGALLHPNRNYLFAAIVFVQDGTCIARYLDLVVHRAIMDATSWDLLLADLEAALTRNQLEERYRRSFQDWAQSESTTGSTWGLPTAMTQAFAPTNGDMLRDGYVRANGLAHDHPPGNSPVNGHVPADGGHNAMPNQQLVLHIDSMTAALLLESSIHAVLRTEPRDFVTAALYLAVQSIRGNQTDPIIFHTVADGRVGGDSGDFPGFIGCFDRITSWAVQPGVNKGDIEFLRRIKDSRMGYSAGAPQPIGTSSSTGNVDECVFLDLTSLPLMSASNGKILRLVHQKQQFVRPFFTLLPRAFLMYVEPFWAQGDLKFRFSTSSEFPCQVDLSEIAQIFSSALTSFLSQFKTYELYSTLSDFPLLDLTYAELDSLVSSQLKRITPDFVRDVECIFPCSPMQESFLIAQAVHPEMYQCTFVLKINPAIPGAQLDYPRLRATWEHLVDRHASLRTVFIDSVNRLGHFDQVVLKRGPVSLQYLEDGDESTTRELSSRRPVIFENYQVTHRATVYRYSAYSAYFRMDISHAVVDGQSVQVLLRDLCQSYGNESSADSVMPYQDFVSYQQRLPQEDSITYWSHYLAGAQPSFFPINGDRLGLQDLRTVRCKVNVDYEALEGFCGRLNVTTANLFQVAWALVLRSYSGSEDICFSYITSGRQAPLKGINNTVGAFVNTVICRVKMQEAMTVAEMLMKVKNDYVESLDHQYISTVEHKTQRGDFARLKGNTIMSCQRVSEEMMKGSGLAFELIDAVNPMEYDLSLNILTCQDGLEVMIDFWSSRIDQRTVESVSESLQQAFISLLNEDALLAEIDIVASGDITRIREWNKHIPQRVESLMQDRVYEQRLLRPDAWAVQGWDGDLTYAELDDAANKLASHLVRLGTQPETKIPLCFEKSKWAVVSQLAILKAGGCVVPLSTNQPPRRLEIILRDTKASIVLTAEKFAVRFMGILPHVVTVTEAVVSQLAELEAPPCSATPNDASFVIYTSGSTGIPKGVVLTHGSLCTSLHYLGAKFELGPHTRMVQFSAYTFDISIQDIFTTWYYGGCLCIVSEEDRINNLGPAMHSYRVNCAGLTSTVAGLISPDEVPTLETLILLGEPVKPAVVDQWIDHVRVLNAYGPSECSIQCSCCQLMTSCNALNIGFALAGALWVVDLNDCNRLVPVGAPGELLIEGPLQARGYLNDEAKTAAAFITDPAWVFKYGFGSMRRLYRSGDLVHQNLDGSITYIGRHDTQIKVRGQRVEVGEIEHYLMQHDMVLDAAILYPPRGPCQNRLVAFLTLRNFLSGKSLGPDVRLISVEKLPQAKPQLSAVYQYLAAHVPGHILPNVWIPLVSMMPQNESAKLDRKKLGQWTETMDQNLFEALTMSGSQDQTRTPTTLERQVQNVWAAVLNLPISQVPVEQRSFLGLGGDSIAAMRVVAQSRAQGISLAVRDVLESKSIAQLAARVGRSQQPTFTLSDFPLASMTSDSLNRLHNKILPEAGVRSDEIEDVYPCSPIQQGILMSQVKSPSEYRIQQAFEIRTTNSLGGMGLSAERVIEAWQTLVNRHPMMRTIFVPPSSSSGDGLFDQVVLKSCKANIEHKHCEDDDVISQLAVKTNLNVSVFGKPLGHQLTVYSTPSQRIYGKIVISHALVDASSLMLLQMELAQAYDGKLAVDGIGPSYSGYVSYLQRNPTDKALEYWGARLADAQPCYLPTLTMTGLPEAATTKSSRRAPLQTVVTELEAVADLRKFSTTHGVTVANMFQLAWALVLWQYTGSMDISFGYLASGRDVPVEGVREMIGPLINMMVTRIKLDPEVSVRQAIRQVQDDFFDGFNHQRAPLLHIWHTLQLKGQSLFNTSISYGHAVSPDRDEVSLILDVIAGEDPTEYDVNVNVVASGNKTLVSLQYSPDFMSREGATCLIGCLRQAMRSFVDNPDLPIGQVPIVTQEDVQQVCTWNSEVPKTNERYCIHDLVHHQRILQPGAAAICAWDGDLTYKELDDIANWLAHHLVADLGVGPEVMVALCFDKSRWAIVAQLGVLKAGGVVVSVNPKHPTERLEGILTDICAEVMLTTQQYSGQFVNIVSHVLKVDSDLFLDLPKRTGPACQDVKPENAAFIIYTSGSSGVPKGVVLTHSGLCSSFQGHGKAFGMNSSTRSLQFASYTFDMSISDIWATIYHGGCVCVVSEEERMNRLQAAIELYRVNLTQLTPTVAGLLEVSKLTSLKTLVLGGEAVEAAMIERYREAGRVKVLNGYGPSECSIYTTCSAPLEDKSQVSNIGRPLVGGVWVINNRDSICPIGSEGELWIEGPLLARGYLNDKQKTDKSFITDPIWARKVGLQGRRFYRTGDLVRQSPSGDIIYVGRRDTQVKIRGQRVEVGEIEYKAKKLLPAAKGAVASLVMPSGKARSPIVAIAMELDSDPQPDLSADPMGGMLLPNCARLRKVFAQLHVLLTDALPFYMVPKLFVPVLRFPLTTSGKLDRRLLRQSLESLSEEALLQYSLSSVKNVGPTTETEKKLQSLWAAVLGLDIDRVSMHDHFFSSGGDSVTAMRLVSMADSSDISFTVFDVFQYPRLVDLATYIDGQKTLDQQEEVPYFALWKEFNHPEDRVCATTLTEGLGQVVAQCGVSVDDIEDVYPCTPLQEGLMAITAQQPRAYVGRWVFRMLDTIDSQRFKHAWQRLASVASILRTRIVPGELSGALQVVVRQPMVWFEGRDLDLYMMDDAQKSFAYGSPLVRPAIIETVEKERYFILTAHHSVYDGRSLAKLFDAVSQLYSKGDIPSVPSYTRFIRHVGQQDSTAAKSFWQSQLEGDVDAPFPTLPWPSYRPRPLQRTSCRLSIQEVDGSITLASLLRAAWALVVSASSGDNVLFGVPLSGRAAPVRGILDILAPTITTVPVKIHIDSTALVSDYLTAVHQQAVDMIPFEHTGLQHIRRLVSNAVDIHHLFAVQPANERENLMGMRLLGLEPRMTPVQDFDGYALTVECITGLEDESAIEVEARFDETVVSGSQAKRLLDRFKHIFGQLLRIINSDNEKNVRLMGDIEMLSPEEVIQLAQWNHRIPEVEQALVHGLVHQQTLIRPDAPAICSWDGNLSYCELDQLAEMLAHHLVNLGVGPEVMVAVCFDKSKWAVVSMLAVLKAGGVVVPIRAQPMLRVQAILQDTGVTVVLTTPRPASRFPGIAPHVLVVDDALFSKLPSSSGRMEQVICPKNAAFVIYTSGSTGVPKGVVLEHGRISTSMQFHGARFGMNSETRAFQFSHFTFDISLHDIFTTLQFGGCICLPSEEERMNNLAGAIRRMGVNYTFLPPRVLSTIQPSDIPNVRTLIVGGEAVQAEHVESWLQSVRVFNAYGPAECSIISTCNEVVDKAQAPNIGRALAGGLWVVDKMDYNRLLPVGAVGELLIEGPLLARGYLNDPEKTSSAFISNPAWLAQYRLHSSQSDGSGFDAPHEPALARRMYRTRDLVRLNDDGSLAYVGRRDNQVKIRGQRVEIGDIEHHLIEQPAVVDAVVLYPCRGPSESRLVGLLTLRDFVSETGPDVQPTSPDQLPKAMVQVSSVRQHLLGCVPEYMVPGVWISLTSMPQNNSDKIDRRKLMQWLETMDMDYFESITRAEADDTPKAPATILERQLQTVWGEILQLPLHKVAMNRPFLSMGGDSITAMQVVSHCRTRYGISLSVRDVLQSKSITELALKARPERAKTEDADITDSPFDLSPIQQLYFEFIAPQGMQVDGENRFNQSVCLVAQRSIDVEDLIRAANALVAKHAMLRARFHQTDHGWTQRIKAEVEESFHFGVHDVQSSKEAEEVILSAQRHLNLEEGPVFSADWIKVASNDRQLFFLTAHHLVVDYVSWRIIVSDLDNLISHSGPTVLSKTTSFQNWTRLQIKHSQEYMSLAKSHLIETPLADWGYWGLVPECNIYGDRVTEEVVLEEYDTSLLIGGSQPLRTEPVHALLAALFHSFHQVFPDRSVPTIVNEAHGREPWTDSIDLSSTVGWFTALMPIHVPVDNDDLIDILWRTQDMHRKIREQGLAYFSPRLLTADGRSALALAEVMFNYIGRDQQPKGAESLFRVEHNLNGANIGKSVRRLAVFEIEASVYESRLLVSFNFSERMHKKGAVQRWAQSYHSSLKELVRQLSISPPTYTPSDFPAANMTYDELTRLQTELLPQAGIANLSEVEEIYPCSPLQQGILMSQIKDHTTYQVQQVFEILATERVDLYRLSSAWEAVVYRHPILRTVFIQSVSGRDLFYQVVLKQWKSRARRISCECANDVVFAFTQEGPPKYANCQPPHQLTLCETAVGQTYARLDISHTLVDAFSLGLILRNFIQAYDGVLPSPAPSYGTYVSFLRQTSGSESLDYWKDRLAGAQPFYFPRSHGPTTKMGALKSVTAEFDDLRLLHNFRDTHGVTIANIMQLAWAVVLARYTGSIEVIFGYLANGRDVPVTGINDMVGPVINMMVTRVCLGAKEMTIAQAVKQVQEDFLEAFNHQRTSLGDIQHALRLSEQNLFNTTVTYIRHSAEDLESSTTLRLKALSGEDPTEYDLNLRIMDSENKITLALEYASSFLDDESARRLLGSLRYALGSIISNNQDSLYELEIIGPSDVKQLVRWNSEVSSTTKACVHDLICQQRLSQPAASAVCAWDGQLTYLDLDSLADRLAHHLTSLGVSREVMVGLCFDKSMWTVVAMLAVLKAGGVIVPLDTRVPLQRLQIILDDAGASVILTMDRYAAKFKDLLVNHVLTIDAAFFGGLPKVTNLPACQTLSAKSAAVVIYTSGSTGHPKGVVLTHGSLCTSIERHGAKLNLGSGTRALQFSAYIFDVSLLDIFSTLRFGGCVCVVSEEDRMNIRNLAGTMEAMGVNFAVLTPTVAALMEPEAVPTLRTLALAGEVVQPTVVETWSPHVDVFNCYGPAECTILATINGPITDEDRSSNVGAALAGALWVVDPGDHNRLVPIGAVGELLIEGPLLAREYLHDPERTAEAFVADPTFISRHGFGLQTGRRMYRTGDLVRQNPGDGSITYLRRSDDQVKVRGQRVEVGEVEYWVKRNYTRAQTVAVDLVTPRAYSRDAILAVAVEIQKQGTDNSFLVREAQFMAITDSLRQSLLELQAALTQALPSFMVPAIYVPLQQMPLTASGKLDRKSLRVLLESLSEEQLSRYSLAEVTNVEPSTRTERRLQELWAEAFNTAGDIGANAHFFRSGGDSVTAMRLVAQAGSARPPILLSVADVFKNPVLSDMARTVDERLAEKTMIITEAETDAPPFSLWVNATKSEPDRLTCIAAQCNVAAEAIEDIYPCTPLQEGLMAITAKQQQAYINRWVFRMDESIDTDRFRNTWQRVFDLAPTLRTRILQDPMSGAVQVVIREQVDWVSVFSDVESFVAQDLAKPMGFGSPLMRFAIIVGSSERFFVWTAHHSVYDGWGARKLLEMASKFYFDQAPPKPVPYTRFVRYLQQTNSRPDPEKYWWSQLQGGLGPSFPPVPKHYQPGSTQRLIRRINTQATVDEITTATLLRGAWALIVSRETGSQDVVFAMPLSGRTAPVPGILDIIGPTVTTVPVRIHLNRAQRLSEYLAIIQQQATDMIPFEHTGLQNIRPISLDSSFTFQHLFAVQPSVNRLDRSSAIFPGLELVPLEVPKFDNYPLVVECSIELEDHGCVIELEVRFDHAVLSAEKMQSLLEQFEYVFSQLQRASSGNVETGDRLVGDVDLLSPRDVRRIHEWNQWSHVAVRFNSCVHELVYQQRLSRPDAPAVYAWDGNLSYLQLDQLTSRLAHHLVSLGVGPEMTVAVIFEKTQWAVVAQLAVLKAGGIVVPVNHQHPTQRIQGILEAIDTKVILTSRSLQHFHDLVPYIVIVDHKLLAQLPNKDFPACETVRPTNAAFVIFTSGSTGIPKGVVLEHNAIVTSLQAHGALYAGPNTRTLQFSAYNFDASIAEIFTTLVFGGCVCLVSEEDRVNRLADAMEAAGVNFAMLTPTVANLLKPQEVPTLETLMLVGEALKPEVVLPWTCSHIRLLNAYGPTECSILTTLSRPITERSQVPNIGTALAGSNLWVVDPSDYHQLVPVGIVGELLIEGPLLARGYLGDEQRTAKAFVTDPAWLQRYDFRPSSGRRIYRTGDLVRQNLDGSLVYVGRQDTQVKIHGQRIEIGEIESWVKAKLPEVREVVAGLIGPIEPDAETYANDTILAVAIEVRVPDASDMSQQEKIAPILLPASDGFRQLFDQLRRALLEVMPVYMVPQLYLPVAELPLTDSGKLNRRAIWNVIQQSPSLSQYFLMNKIKVPPSTLTEWQLQELWATTLNVPARSIGVRDDFFHSGGDSISAMRLVARARENGRLSLSVADVFRYPTLLDLAAAIADRKHNSLQPPVIYERFTALEVTEPTDFIRYSISPLLSIPGVIVDAAPTTDFQALSVVASLQKSRDLLAYVSVDGDGIPNIDWWKLCCLELVKRHDILRTGYIFHDGQLLQVVLQEYRPNIEHYETEQTIDQFTKLLVAQDMHRPPQLGRPFVEFAIITSRSVWRHRILFRLSHGEYDAISMSYFISTLQAIYNRQPTTNYPSFSRYMYSLSRRNKEESRQYWRTILRGSSMPTIAGPSSPRRQQFSKLIYHATRKVVTTKALPGGITMSTIIRAAWAQVLTRHIGNADVVFGEVVSGRNTGDPVAEKAAGCCVNIVPVRVRFDDSWTILDLLGHLQEQQLARLSHETLGFREILRSCSPMPSSTYFSSRLNYLDQVPEWTLSIGEVEYRVSLAMPEGAGDLADICITSFLRIGHVEIAFGYLSDVISPSLADELLSSLCTTVDLFLNGPHDSRLDFALPGCGERR